VFQVEADLQRSLLYTLDMSHQAHDLTSLALARRIAEGLETHPEWIVLARGNLRRWSEQNAQAPRLLACYAEWSEILEGPMEELRQRLLDEGDEGQRLRQNSPFAGALSTAEVRRIKGGRLPRGSVM